MVRHGLTVPAIVVVLAVLAKPVSAEPQESAADDSRCSLGCEIGRDFKSFATSRRSLAVLGAGLGLSWAASGLDEQVSQGRINSELYPDTILDRVLEPGEIGGGTPVQAGVAVATLAFGAVAKNQAVKDLGSALVRAQLVNGVFTTALKMTVRRERPDGSDRRSFPSGHTSGSFATAVVLQRNFGWKVGAPALAFATLVGASRMSEDKHHLSDVIFGAAVGISSGLSVGMRTERSRVEVGPQLVPAGMGLELSVSWR